MLYHTIRLNSIMATLGQRLREEREKRGLSIDDLAAQTRINPQHFLAIENDDISSLPGSFFYRSFVRQYARLLNLPEEAYQAEVDRSIESEASITAKLQTALPDLQFSVPPIPTEGGGVIVETRRWIYRLAVLAFVIVVCSGVYTFWQRYQSQKEETASAAQQNQSSAPAPVKQAPAPVAPAAEPSKPDETAAANQAATPAGAPTESQPVTPAPVTPAPATSNSADGVQLILKASELSWVGVWKDERQQFLFGDVIQPGESRGFGAADKLRVRFGNAGGIEVKWNGQVIPAVGPRGQVRTVDFRKDGYTVVLPAPKPGTDPAVTPPQP